jgi:hypothetical protein
MKIEQGAEGLGDPGAVAKARNLDAVRSSESEGTVRGAEVQTYSHLFRMAERFLFCGQSRGNEDIPANGNLPELVLPNEP